MIASRKVSVFSYTFFFTTKHNDKFISTADDVQCFASQDSINVQVGQLVLGFGYLAKFPE